MNPTLSLCVVCSTPSRRQQAQAFSERFGFALVDHTRDDSLLQLRFHDERIELYDRQLDTAIHVDFLHGALAHRQKFGGGKGQAIAKAVGLGKTANKSRCLTILDATAGLARDAWVLATLGCRLTLVERSPVLYTLIRDGIERALQTQDDKHPVRRFTNLVLASSVLYMDHMDTDSHPDVITIDPMYPARKKSALVKKDMQILHKLIGPSEDEGELLQTAVQHARQRVVVKRPIHAEPVANMPPDTQIRSKKTRYDIYLTATGGD